MKRIILAGIGILSLVSVQTAYADQTAQQTEPEWCGFWNYTPTERTAIRLANGLTAQQNREAERYLSTITTTDIARYCINDSKN